MNKQEKFARNWLNAKPEAINNYILTSAQLAQEIINSKQKLVNNFLSAMDGSKFDDKLKEYIGNDKLGNAYRDGVNAKTSFTESELKKVENSIELKRNRFLYISDTIEDILDGRFGFFPLPNYDFKFSKRIRMEFEIAYQKALKGRNESVRTSYPIYNETRIYLVNNFGWVYANAQSMTEPQIKKMYEATMTEIQ